MITLGGVMIGPKGDFTDSTTSKVSTLEKRWYPVPTIYMSSPLGKKVAFGLGVFAPYGLTTEWPTTSQGRFLGYKSLVQAVYVQPTLAYKVNDKLSVGVGVDLTYLNVELRQRVDLSSQAFGAGTFGSVLGVAAGTDFADVQMRGHKWHAGVNAGVIFKANEKVTFGARFLGGQKVTVGDAAIATSQISAVKADGSVYVLPITIPGVAPAGTPLNTIVAGQFAAGAKLSNQSASSSLPLPAQFVAGVTFQVTPKLKIMTDYQYTNWAAFDQLPINGQYLVNVIQENYKDTHGIRLGAEYAMGEKNVLRVGFDGHGAAAPDETVTPNLPEGSRTEFTVGFGSQMTKRARFDLGYMYLRQPERAGRTGATNNGNYNFMAHLIGASMTLGF
jgi:long-chain fatty acid transport protein